MSALETRRVSSASTCLEHGCTNKGRFEFFIAGYPCLGHYGRELLCEKHAKAWQKAFRALAPDRRHLGRLIAKIGGTPAEGADAVDSLRGAGLGAEQVARIVKDFKGGMEPGEVLDRLLDTEAELVA